MTFWPKSDIFRHSAPITGGEKNGRNQSYRQSPDDYVRFDGFDDVHSGQFLPKQSRGLEISHRRPADLCEYLRLCELAKRIHAGNATDAHEADRADRLHRTNGHGNHHLRTGGAASTLVETLSHQASGAAARGFFLQKIKNLIIE